MIDNIGDSQKVVSTNSAGAEVSNAKAKEKTPGFIPMKVESKEVSQLPQKDDAETAKLEEKKRKKAEQYEKETAKLEAEMHKLMKQLQQMKDSGVDVNSKQYKDLENKCSKVFEKYQKKAFVTFALNENYIPADIVNDINSSTEDQIAYEYMDKRTGLFDKATKADDEEAYQRERLALETEYENEIKQYEGKEIPPQIENKYRLKRANLIMSKNDKWTQWSIYDLKAQNEQYSQADMMRQNPQGFKVNNVSSEVKFRNDSNVNSVSVDAQYVKGQSRITSSVGVDNQNFYNGTTMVQPKASLNASTQAGKFNADVNSNYSSVRNYYGESVSDTKSVSYGANVNYNITDRASVTLGSNNYTTFTDASYGSSKMYTYDAGLDTRFPLSKTVSMNAGYRMQYDSYLGHKDQVSAGVNYNGKVVSAGLNSSYDVTNTSSSVSERINVSVKNKDYSQKGGVMTSLSGSWTRSDMDLGEGEFSGSSVQNSFNTQERIAYRNNQGREISVSHSGYYYSQKMDFGEGVQKSSSAQNTVSIMATQLGKNKDWGVGAHYTWNEGQTQNPNEFGVSVTKRF